MEEDKKLNKKELISKIKELYPYYTNISLYNVEQLRKIFYKSCNKINIFNENNSCYLDSLFVSLFSGNNEIIKNIFIDSDIIDYKNDDLYNIAVNIKKELLSIYNIITSITKTKNYCNNLRKLLQDYHNIKYSRKSIRWRKDQMESLDVITFLSVIFKIKNSNKINIKKYGTNSLKKQIIYKNLELISDINDIQPFTTIIPIEKLLDVKKLEIKKLYPIYIDDAVFSKDNLWKPSSKKIYKRKIEKITFLSGNLLFIHINRNNYFIQDGEEPQKINTKVIPSLKIKMKENKNNLYLRSIIVHRGIFGGGHYICIYECNGKWYEYDDTNPEKKLIGSGNFEDVCEYKDGYILKNCTNLVYY